MKSLNHKQINQASNQFMAWLFSLLIVITACVYCFMKASTNQFSRLVQQKEAFDQVFRNDALLSEKVDSLYAGMDLLNTGKIQSDRQMQRIITRQKEVATRMASQQQKNQPYFVVYNRLFGHINEMLLLKDSLSKAMVEESDLRDELNRCLKEAIEEHRQRNRSGK